MTIRADRPVLALLAMLVERRTGLHHADRDADLFAAKVRDHAQDRGFSSVLDLYTAITYDDPRGERFDALIDALIVGETYFLRELSGLERVIDAVAERAAGGRSTRVWCAAAASGEEPLSLAALAARAGLLDRVDLVATDLAARQVARARAGQYSARTLRSRPEGLPPWIRREGDRVVVDDAVRARVTWARVNLVAEDEVRRLGTFNLILYRNVLIYFAEPTARRVAALLEAALAPGGVLLLGAAESLLRLGTSLEVFERRGTFLYRKGPG